MFKLISKLFKKTIAISHTISEYQPKRVNSLKVEVVVKHFNEFDHARADEMQIDHLYEKN